ncbi:LysR family transcriptional regulator [Pseudorhodoferax sp.]|uniref:LysR family transcriptional regulator n=1 Tax=Pseudorhodoferax sp. TaxID=1993553 RepID=UPI002DD64858|nr:LysR family transcriptional regulator [Pseudorhodoferax sp.]
MRWTASDFERLEPRLFRAFLAVVRTGSFSAAAADASLTQGAISQQIAKLEERLNTQLFVRAGNRVLTTMAGRLLAEHAQAYMDHTSRFLEELNEEFESMRGFVGYAMPESCIHAPHFGWLLERRKSHPDLVLGIELKPSAAVMADVLGGVVDFGFVNRAVEHPNVLAYPFCAEQYVLVAAATRPERMAPESLDALLSQPMIVYPGMLDCLNLWIARHFGEVDPISAVSLRVNGQFNDIRGALAMVTGDLGLTVLPLHVAAPSIEQQSIRVLASGRPIQATQQIWIVRLRDRRMPARVKRVIRWFLEMHTELQPVPEEFLT